MTVDSPGQHVLERTAVQLQADGAVEARFTVGLPARGRSVLGQWAVAVLVHNLPRWGARGSPVQSAFGPRRLGHQAPTRHPTHALQQGTLNPKPMRCNREPCARPPIRTPKCPIASAEQRTDCGLCWYRRWPACTWSAWLNCAPSSCTTFH
jgi:Predicted ATPase of the ABC class